MNMFATTEAFTTLLQRKSAPATELLKTFCATRRKGYCMKGLSTIIEKPPMKLCKSRIAFKVCHFICFEYSEQMGNHLIVIAYQIMIKGNPLFPYKVRK